MESLSELALALPATRGSYELALAAMCARSGAARAAYAALRLAVGGEGLFARMRRFVLTARAAECGVHGVVVRKGTVRFAMPHPALKKRRVSVHLHATGSAEIAGHLHAEFAELGGALVRLCAHAGVACAAEVVTVLCCQVYWYTGACVDLDAVGVPSGGAWAVVGRGPPLRLRTASGLVSACVYGNGTVSFVARCVEQLGRVHGELFDAMVAARAPAASDSRPLGYNINHEARGHARRGDAEESSESEYDDNDAANDRRAPAPRVSHAAIAKRRPRRAVVVHEQEGRVRGGRRGACVRDAQARGAGREAPPA